MRPMFALIAAAIALAACQPQTDDGSPAVPPADAPPPALPAVFTGDIDARGTEPFWSLTIRGNQLTLSRPDQPNLIVGNSKGGALEGQAAVFGYEPLTVRLTETKCSDGMSDLTYPLTAEVTVQGQTLKGCAAKTAEAPRAEDNGSNRYSPSGRKLSPA